MAENIQPATIQDQEDAKVTAGRGRAALPASDLPDKVHTWPYLVRAEFIAGCVLLLVLMVWSITVDAPMEEPANPTKTPNPSKAPWYFLGLQEMLVYFDPWIAGVLLPSLIIVGLMIIPYVDINPKGNGYYTWSEMGAMLFGAICVLGWLVGIPGAVWQWKKDTPFMRQLGMMRYGIVATLFMIMAGVLVKMALRLSLN